MCQLVLFVLLLVAPHPGGWLDRSRKGRKWPSPDTAVAGLMSFADAVCKRNIQGTFREHSVNIQGKWTFREHLGSLMLPVKWTTTIETAARVQRRQFAESIRASHIVLKTEAENGNWKRKLKTNTKSSPWKLKTESWKVPWKRRSCRLEEREKVQEKEGAVCRTHGGMGSETFRECGRWTSCVRFRVLCFTRLCRGQWVPPGLLDV
jgi:hypothetical protein